MPKLYLFDSYNSTLINDDNTFANIPYTTSLKTYILKEDTEIFTKDGKHFNGKKGDGVAVITQYQSKSKTQRHFFFKLDAESLKEYNEFLEEEHAKDVSVTSSISVTTSEIEGDACVPA